MKRFAILALVATLVLPSMALAGHCGKGGCGLRGKAKAVGGRVLKALASVFPRNR